jgi:hypothetical protein
MPPITSPSFVELHVPPQGTPNGGFALAVVIVWGAFPGFLSVTIA